MQEKEVWEINDLLSRSWLRSVIVCIIVDNLSEKNHKQKQTKNTNKQTNKTPQPTKP